MIGRSEWLKEKRRETEERYDTLWAPLYGKKWGLYNNATHQKFIHELLGILPKSCSLLDAACGAGRYFPMLIDEGHTVVGIDQSLGMLSRVMAEFPSIHVEKVGLQEMRYDETFDGVICVDAMEHICPEGWLLVLNNFHRALKPHGYLYFTVELADAPEIEAAFVRGQESGLPIVLGEWINGDVYHYYPAIQQVREWVKQAPFQLIREGDGDSYHHFIVKRRDCSAERPARNTRWTAWKESGSGR